MESHTPANTDTETTDSSRGAVSRSTDAESINGTARNNYKSVIYLTELKPTPYRRLFRVDDSPANDWADDEQMVERVAASVDPRAAFYGFMLIKGDVLYLKINTAPQSAQPRKPHIIKPIR